MPAYLRVLIVLALGGALLTTTGRSVRAQDSESIIFVKTSHTGQDSLGTAVARALDGELAADGDFQVVEEETSADVLLLLQTIDPLEGTETASYMTVYSIVLLQSNGRIIKTWIGRTGRTHVDDSAETILATVTDYVTSTTGP